MPRNEIACCRECGRGYQLPGPPPCGHSQAPAADSPLGQLIASFKPVSGACDCGRVECLICGRDEQRTIADLRSKLASAQEEIASLKDRLFDMTERREKDRQERASAQAAMRLTDGMNRHLTGRLERAEQSLREKDAEIKRLKIELANRSVLDLAASERARIGGHEGERLRDEIERLTQSIADAEGAADAAGFPEGAYLADVITLLVERNRALREALEARLKGAFIVHPGGRTEDALSFLAALSSPTPEDQKKASE